MTSPSVFSKQNSAFSTAEKPASKKQYSYPPLFPIKKDTKTKFQQILNQKCITFIYMMAKRQKIVNEQKHLLFSNYKINMLKLFNFIDCQNSQFIDSDNLSQYFPNSQMIAKLYSNIHTKGKIRFSDFVRMVVPLQYNISLIQQYEENSIYLQLLDKVFKIFKIMSDNERQNVQELNVLRKELKLDSPSRLFQNYCLLKNLFQENNLKLSDVQISLIFFKLDKNGDGILELLDFEGYY